MPLLSLVIALVQIAIRPLAVNHGLNAQNRDDPTFTLVPGIEGWW
jgi:hypothetical protein